MPSLGGPPLVTNGVYQTTIMGELFGEDQQIMNVYHHLCISAVAGDGMQDLMATLFGLFNTNMIPLLNQIGVWHRCICKHASSVTQDVGPPITYKTIYDIGAERIVGNVAGGVATPALPGFVTVGAQNKSALIGLTRNGSKRFGPISEADTVTTSTSTLTGGAFAAFQAAATAMIGNLALFAGSQLVPCIFSPPLCFLVNPAQPATGATQILSAPVSPLVGTSLSRKERFH